MIHSSGRWNRPSLQNWSRKRSFRSSVPSSGWAFIKYANNGDGTGPGSPSREIGVKESSLHRRAGPGADRPKVVSPEEDGMIPSGVDLNEPNCVATAVRTIGRRATGMQLFRRKKDSAAMCRECSNHT